MDCLTQVKVEREFLENKLICNFCLSTGRYLRPINEFIELCTNIFSNCSMACDMEHLLLCWECRAMLRNIKNFIEKVKTAQAVFINSVPGPDEEYHTLSTLTFNLNQHKITLTGEETIETLGESQLKIEYDSDGRTTANDSEQELVVTDLKMESDKTENSLQMEGLNVTPTPLLQPVPVLAKKPKDRTLRYKVVEGINYTNNYRSFQIKSNELDYWLEKDRQHHFYVKSLYKCEKCITGFRKKNKLQSHIRMYHSQSPGMYTCDVCDINLSMKNALAIHTRQHYLVYECNICQFQCHRPHMVYEHFRKEHRKKFQCLKCDISFNNVHAFYKHYKGMHRQFICDHCGKACSKKSLIRRHIRRQHIPYTCGVCKITFKHRHSYKVHQSMKHTQEPTDATYCVECDMRFNNERLFRRHVLYSAKHRSQRKPQPKPPPVSCPECGKLYARRTFMMNHFRLVHLRRTSHYCERCDKYFLNATRYKEHRLYVHEGARRELNKFCYICGRGFAATRTLVNHIRTHTGERPHGCPHCPAKFVQKYAMQTHVKTIHLRQRKDGA